MTRSQRRRTVALAVVGAIILGGATYVSVHAGNVHHHLSAAAGLLQTLRQQAVDRDAGARTTLALLQEETGAARSQTEGLAWRLGGRLPIVGADAAAVRTVAAALDDIARQTLPRLLDIADSVPAGTVLPSGGRVAVDALWAAAPKLVAADDVTRRVRERLVNIPLEKLLPAVRSAVGQVIAGVDKLASLTGAAAKGARLIPVMLGTTRPRTYLMIFQNPAEIRASGGMPGAFAVIRADRGAITMVGQGSAAADLQAFDASVLPLDPAMRALYGDRLGTFPANVNLTPHFPTSAALIREMYRRRSGTTVDGVLSVDPLALSYLLEATGPLPMPTGPALKADTVVEQLLVDSYADITGTALADVRAKDQYLATAARTVFEALTHGISRPGVALTSLARAAAERRILVWSAEPREQEVLDGTPLQGVLPLSDGARP
ncbi:MAG TPA: DUF4012 domain-containing protein, partial [Asanoa sp.]|nr:DUF4012 domain-containing protein [Asanoa sp.]